MPSITARENLIAQIVESFSADDRCVAAWLTGSLGRGDADAWSDIDITVVVTDTAAEVLCQRPFQSAAHTTPERLTLFSQFGAPAIIHENNYNAPDGGTFTCVIYAESLVTVDWILRPSANAGRSPDSRLLFSKQPIPLLPEPSVDSVADRLAHAAEQTAFFWMMTTITIKYIARGDSVFVNQLLEMLRYSLYEVDRALTGEPYRFSKGAQGQLAATKQTQIEAVRGLCSEMTSLSQQLESAGGEALPVPSEIIEQLLSLAAK